VEVPPPSPLPIVSRSIALGASWLGSALERRLADRRMWIGLGLSTVAVISLVGWVAVLTSLDPRRMNDLGLISVIPVQAFLSIVLLSVSFVLALRMQPQITPVLMIHVAALAVMLYGAPAFFEDLPRFATAWLHLGFSEAIARTGELYPLRDARFDWPAFFAMAAFLSSATGFELLPVLQWFPPVVMILYLGPLYLIMRTASSDGRLVWLAVWIFYLLNWVGQDYFSPQAFNVLLLLAVLAVLLSWFRRAPGASVWSGRFGPWMRRRIPSKLAAITVDAAVGRKPAGISGSLSNRQQVGLVSIVAVLFGASVASHQLTPFALLGGVLGLTVFNRIRLTGLSVFMIVLLSSWLMFMASTFLAGHLAGLLEEIGRPDQIAASNIGDRLVGSPGHLLVLRARLGLTLGLWLVAGIGALRRLRSGQLDLTVAVLAVAPFGLVLLQAYGGEMLLRVYLFSVPFMAFFAAAAFLPTPRAGSWRLYGFLAVVSVVLAGVLLLTRYGNEKADFVTIEEYEVLQRVAQMAGPRDSIGSANHSVPLGYMEWEEHRIVSLDSAFRDGAMDLLLVELADRTPDGQDSYFVVTRGQRAFGELFWGMPDAEWDRRVREVAEVTDLLYSNRDGAVYRLRDPQPAAPP
jgi:hypothetical protein